MAEFLEFVAQRPLLEEFDFQVNWRSFAWKLRLAGLACNHKGSARRDARISDDKFREEDWGGTGMGELDPKPQSIALEWGH